MSKKIVITIDVASGDTSVTDETGKATQSKKFPLDGSTLGEISEIKTICVMATHNSPGCRWVLIDGVWNWICD